MQVSLNIFKTNQIPAPQTHPVYFCGKTEAIEKDIFEKNSQMSDVKINLFDPNSKEFFSKNCKLDLSKEQKIELTNNGLTSKNNGIRKYLIADYNPQRKGTLIDKINQKPITTTILRVNNDSKTTYSFLSEDLSKQYGYVELKDYKYPQQSGIHDFLLNKGLLCDYPELDIYGERTVVEYLRNFNDYEVGGVGKLADVMAVRHCIENGMEPNILSKSGIGSHVAHFLRGKRFISVDSCSPYADFFQERYSTLNINKILKTLIKNAKDGKVDISHWGLLIMYLPKDLAMKYAKDFRFIPA